VKRRPLVALLAAAALAPTALSGFANSATAQIVIKCAAPASPAAAAPESSPAATPTTASTAVTFPPGGGDLTVFAAASLTDAFEEIAAELESASPGLAVTFNFGGSPTLVTQLEQGADADVFASANLAQMDAAEENGSIAGEPVVFVRNRLAIVVPASNPAAIDDAADLANDGVKLILANADVPVGRYARESLCLMGADPSTYGEGFVDRVAANVVSEEEDVRDVLAKIELGEADAGIVYVSDAQIGADAIVLVEIPDAVNRVAAYPIAAVAGGDPALAGGFIAAVLSAEGQGTLEGFGFEPVG
jgi:molybdate transport system substrate-binding protein